MKINEMLFLKFSMLNLRKFLSMVFYTHLKKRIIVYFISLIFTLETTRRAGGFHLHRY
jgi:hypothetical protein